MYYVLFMAVFGLGMSIYSFSNTVSSYGILAQTVESFEAVVRNWDAKPLLDVQFVSAGSNCPTGYEPGVVSPDSTGKVDRTAKVPETVGQFPGSEDYCECGDKGFYWRYAYYKYSCDCSSCIRTKDRKCPSSSSLYACSYSQRDRGCRTKADPNNPYYRNDRYETKRGKCTTNATKAGCRDDAGLAAKALTNMDDKVICYKRGGDNAITRTIGMTATTCPTGTVSCGRQGEGMTALCAKTAAECPLTDISGGFRGTALNKSNGFTNTLPIVEVRVTPGPVCLYGDKQSEGIKGRQNNIRINRKLDAGCVNNDPRYNTWELFPEADLYKNNSIGTTGGRFLTGRDSGQMQYSYTTPIQRYDTYTQYNWILSFRRQIAWREDCGGSNLAEIEKKLAPVNEMKGIQYTLMVLNGIFGLGILGIILPLTYIARFFDKDQDLECIPGEGEDELNYIDRIKRIVGNVARFAKFLPLVLCILSSGTHRGFFNKIGDASCSDPQTNSEFSATKAEINKLYNSNIQNLGIDLAMVFVEVATEAYAYYKKKKAEEEANPPPSPEPEKEKRIQIEIGGGAQNQEEEGDKEKRIQVEIS
eukprot:g1057.t1